MCRNNMFPCLIECRYPSKNRVATIHCIVGSYTQAFKLMYHLLEHGVLEDCSDFEMRPVRGESNEECDE